MDGNPASIYSLIHAFLTKNSHTKAAQAVKKAAKEVVILKDDIDLEGPQLDEIIAQWKSLKASSRNADSESDSDSSTSSRLSNRQTNKVKVKGTQKNAPSSEESESSSSESDSDSDLIESIKAPVVVKTEISVPPAKVSSESSSSPKSSSDSDDESSDLESTEQMENVDKEVNLNTDKRPKLERDSSRTLSSQNTSRSCSESNDKESLISPKRESSASTDSSSETETPKTPVEQVQVTKKRRTDRGGTAVTTATTLTVRKEKTGPKSTGRIKGNPKPGRQFNERFRRVDPSKMEVIADNRYVAKVAPTNDYGQRAHEDLIVTRGQGFRKEKNKKKKGSYRGGEITMESHSFKFA